MTSAFRPQAQTQLEALVAARVLRETAPGEYAFRHALTHDAVYSTLLHRERRQAHHAVADTLVGLYEGTPQLARQAGDLAYHYELAEDWALALTYARAAGEEALLLYAPNEAIAQFTRALHAAEQLGRPPEAALYRARAAGFETIGDFDAAQADLSTAVEKAQAAGDITTEWQALLDLGLLWVSRDYDRAGELFEQALRLARQTGDRAALAHSLNRIGNWRMNLGELAEAMRRHGEALTIFTELNDLAGQAETYDLLGMTNFHGGDLMAGARFYERAVALFRKVDDRRGQVSTLGTMVLRGPTAFTDTAVSAATMPIAVRDGQAALQLARSIHQRSGEAYALNFLGVAYAAQGEFGLALTHARAGLALAEAIQHTQWQIAGFHAVGIVCTELLDQRDARICLEQALELAGQISSPYWINMASGDLAKTCARAWPPDLPGARAALEAAQLKSAERPQGLAERDVWAARAEAALAAREGAEALRLVDILLEDTVYLGQRGAAAVPRLARLRGEALVLLGQSGEALDLLEAAIAEAARLGSPTEQMRLQLALARAAQASQQAERAQAALRQASTLADQMAATVSDPVLRRGFEREVEARLVAAVQA